MKAIIVEDELAVAQDLSEMLEEMGYAIPAIAMRADEAIEAIGRHNPDIVLIDVKLRGEEDGIDLAHILRGRWEVPFLFITAHTDPDTVRRAKAARPYGYVVKPFGKDDVYAATEIALSNYAEEQAAGPLSNEAEEETGSLPPYRLRRVKAYIAEHLGEKVSVSDLAEVVGMSRGHFTRQFARATGVTPYHYVMERRINEAKRLLVETDLPITRIALRIGFGSQSHLTKVFRQYVGTPPGSYRAAQ